MVLDNISSRILDIGDYRNTVPRERVEYTRFSDIGTTDNGNASEHREYGMKNGSNFDTGYGKTRKKQIAI